MQLATKNIPQLPSLSVLSIINAAFEAGEGIMEIYTDYCTSGETVQLDNKGDGSPLTKADIISHNIILGRLQELTPDIPVVSEESYTETRKPPADTYWLIDPLDGTKEFLKNSGEFTVNIALIHNRFPVFGVVYAPVLDECFVGGEEIGAYHYHHNQWREMNARLAPAPHLRVIASKSHMCARTEAFIAALGTCELVQAGSSLKFCRIATGEADVYPRMGPTSEWDTAAAQAVVEAMGGTVCDLEGNRLIYGKATILNPSFVASSNARKNLNIRAG